MSSNPALPARRSYMDVAEEALRLTDARPRPPSPEKQKAELERCAANPEYFIDTYCQIYDNATAQWIPFKLWPAQRETVRFIMSGKYTLILKARQQGLTWLVGVALTIWQMRFRPIAEVLLFSQRDDEAIKVLDRVRGMYERLPDWMKLALATDAAHELRLANGSGAQALPASTGGRSNAATYAVVDEADFITDPASLINFVKPTIDAGENKLVVLSTVNKATPGSYYQRLYKTARQGSNRWQPIFLPWNAHPGRTQKWYDEEKRAALANDFTLDSIYEQYPATDIEALSARTLDKRYPPQWLAALSHEKAPLPFPFPPGAPALPTLRVYKLPEPGHTYGMGLDPAGGGSDADSSVACVVDADTAEQVAVLSGKIEPTEFANHAADVALWYFRAPILVELNNHGHATLAQLKHRGMTLRNGITRSGPGRAPGWLTTERSKYMLYDTGGKVMRDALNEADAMGEPPLPILYDFQTMLELSQIDINSLSAPEGEHDDHAMAWVLAQQCVYRGAPGMQQLPFTGLYRLREQGVTKPGALADPREKKIPDPRLALPRLAPPTATLDGKPVETVIEPADEDPVFVELKWRRMN